MIAVLVVGAWAGSLALGLWADLSISSLGGVAQVVAFVALRTFLYVGLFITAHDAMHGTVVRGRRGNDLIGTLCVALYSWLPYRNLRARHHEHHARPAREGDPDWSVDQRFWPWLWAFLLRYVTGWVVLRNAVVVCAIVALPGGTVLDALALHAVPAWLSVLQLFTFGTWLPHRGDHPGNDVHRARSADVPALVSFVSCYHFGYHQEHHRAPHVPWWGLPAERALTVAGDAQLVGGSGGLATRRDPIGGADVLK